MNNHSPSDNKALREERDSLQRQLFLQEDRLRNLPTSAKEEQARIRGRVVQIKRRLDEIESKVEEDSTEEPDMIRLTQKDRERLRSELNRLPNWVDGGVQGEKSVLRAAGLPESFMGASLEL